MDQALEQGINFFDTANFYGFHLGAGVTEQIIGRWLAQGGRRDTHRPGDQGLRQNGRERKRARLVGLPPPPGL